MERTDYGIIAMQLKALIAAEPNYISVLANASALLMESMENLNWAGFYLVMEGMLKVGPFQGKSACVLIRRGKGVCGSAWNDDRTIIVPDVHDFPGHIACDSESLSEIVVPIHAGGSVVAVLDIDSPEKNRFSEEDKKGLEQFVRLLEESVDWRKASLDSL